MISLDRQKEMIWSYLITAATALILYLVFIPAYSYTAAAIITVYSEVLISLLAWRLVRKHTGVSIAWFTPLKLIAAALLMGLVVAIVPIEPTTIGLLVKIGLGVVAYGTFALAFGAVRKGDILQVIRRSTAL